MTYDGCASRQSKPDLQRARRRDAEWNTAPAPWCSLSKEGRPCWTGFRSRTEPKRRGLFPFDVAFQPIERFCVKCDGQRVPHSPGPVACSCVSPFSCSSIAGAMSTRCPTPVFQRHRAPEPRSVVVVPHPRRQRVWVLRRAPRYASSSTAHDVLREFRILDAIKRIDAWRLHVPILRVSADPDVFGAPFYLMDHIDGSPIRTALPAAWANAPHTHGAALEQLIDAIVEAPNISFNDLPSRFPSKSHSAISIAALAR